MKLNKFYVSDSRDNMESSKFSHKEDSQSHSNSTSDGYNNFKNAYSKVQVRPASLDINQMNVKPPKKNALMLQNILPGFSGTLKSKREQKRISDYLSRNESQELSLRKLHFDNIREIFEKREDHLKISNQTNDKHGDNEKNMNETQNIPNRDKEIVLPDSEPYEKNDIPPRISAMLSQRKNVIRPIAFKPVPYNSSNINNKNSTMNNNLNGRLSNNMTERYGSTPSLVPSVGNHHKFGSTNDLNIHLGQLNYSSLPRKNSTTIPFKTYDSLESILNLPDSITPTQYISKSSQWAYKEFLTDDVAPSPSDSNISELEAALRERDSELAHLRRTMEHNEKDKERHWEMELGRLKAIHENRLKAGAQKVHKLEQLLMMQTFALRQDKKRLNEQIEIMKAQLEKQRKEINAMKTSEINLKDQNNDLTDEIRMLRRVVSELKEKLEDLEWNLCQKNEEVTLIKTELADAQNEIAVKNRQILEMKCVITKISQEQSSNKLDVSQDLTDKNNEKSQLYQIIQFKDQIIEALNIEVQKLQKDLSDFSILSDYEGIPAGHYLRQKYDSMNSTGTNNSSPNSEEKSAIIQNPHISDKPIENDDEIKNVLIYSRINSSQITLENIKNLPDITLNFNNGNTDENIYINSSEDDFKSLSSTQDILSQDQNSMILEEKDKELTKLVLELQKCRENYEADKIKWTQEKEKVLTYQKQLQKKYLEVLSKTEVLETKLRSLSKENEP
uniref:CSON007699 protein n=1 Tax=Culicoides sonorensis TaxID=179676 RepID=A0A336MUI6_CULSO